MDNNIIVSVSCITYNHAKYIRQCLDGILMQKADFQYEILIHDDASTDGTDDIIREYAQKYPTIIKPIFEKENQYSKGVPISATFNYPRAEGKYIALCEGDDYWTDPYKLQKQVVYMESHPGYAMCFTNVDVICDGISKKYLNIFSNIHEGEYTGEQILKEWTIPTASVLYRRYAERVPQDPRFLYGDIVTFLWLSQKGKIWCINDKTAVYRRNPTGVTTNKRSYNREIDHLTAIEEHFGYKEIVRELIVDISINYFLLNRLKKESFIILRRIKELKCSRAFLLKFPKKIYKLIQYKYLSKY